MIEICPEGGQDPAYFSMMTIDDMGPLLLTWFIFNPSMDK